MNRRYLLRALPSLGLGALLLGTLATGVAAQTVPVQIPSTPPEMDTVLGQGTWQWVRSEFGDGSTIEALDPSRYTILFRPDGTLAIRADCNQVGGAYTRRGAQLTFQPGPSTLIGCPTDSQAEVFLRDLRSVATYAFSVDTVFLSLRFDGGNMTFEPQRMTPLVQGAWQVQSYNNGQGGVISAEAGRTLNFAVDGTVNGNAGCNTYRGMYTLNGQVFSVGPLATTRMACAAQIMEQERAFLAALQASSQVSLSGDRLTLRDATGTFQVTLVSGPTRS